MLQFSVILLILSIYFGCPAETPEYHKLTFNGTNYLLKLKLYEPPIQALNYKILNYTNLPEWYPIFYKIHTEKYLTFKEYQSLLTPEYQKLISEEMFNKGLEQRKNMNPEEGTSYKQTIFYDIYYKLNDNNELCVSIYSLGKLSDKFEPQNFSALECYLKKNNHWYLHNYFFEKEWLSRFPNYDLEKMKKILNASQFTTNEIGQFIPVQ